ncbi:MAG TPA: FAD-dependent oxidoreductase, partial [Armatimonadota bacterium]|nr:FAD-dependent oxidoreductase [Armatimonadota bacterium]
MAVTLRIADQLGDGCETVMVEREDLPVLARAQVVVAGGGPAGAMAAIAAGRRGADTLLIEAQPFLGGIGTGGAIHHYYWGADGGIQVELDQRDERAAARVAQSVRGWHHEMRKVVFAELAEEAGVRIWLGTLVTGAVMEGEAVRGVVVDGPHGRGVVLCEVCVDATGDGDIAAVAGAQFALGREGDELQMAYSMTPGVTYREFAIAHANYDAGWVDPTDPWDYARGFVDGRKFLWREPYTPENRMHFCAPNLGLRESRLIVGDYVLTLDDLFFGRRFPDTIGACHSHYDNHARDNANESLEGLVYTDVLGNWQTALGCDVPYRCLLPQGVEGLLVAGRCISMTHNAEQALRMMKDMHRLGEAAGLAAALAVRTGVVPRQVDLAELQRELIAAGLLTEDELAASAGGGMEQPVSADELVAELPGERPAPVMWRLYRMGEGAVPALEQALAGDNEETARWAALVLG